MVAVTGSVEKTNQKYGNGTEQGKVWRQYFIAGIANIAMVCVGYSIGWVAAVAPILLNDSHSPIYVSHHDLNMIFRIYLVGAFFGPFIGGFLATRIGRKKAILSCAVPLLCGWILITIAGNVVIICAGRLICGVAAGALFTVLPMYCAEIATDNRRGALGSYVSISNVCGSQIAVFFGSFTFASYYGLSILAIALVTVFAACFFFMPDSPIYQLTKNDKESAAKCLMSLQGKSRTGVESELTKMEKDVQSSMTNTSSIANVFRGSNFKALCITSGLFLFKLCFESFLIFEYVLIVSSWMYLNPFIVRSVSFIIKLLGFLVASILVDRLGRKILLLISTSGVAVSLGLLATYFWFEESGSPIINSESSLLPVFFWTFELAYSIGLGPLPFVLMSELFSINAKAAGSSITVSLSWIYTTFVYWILSILRNTLSIFELPGLYAAVGVVAFLFTIFLVPETKGKSFTEIQEMLAGKNKPKKEIQP